MIANFVLSLLCTLLFIQTPGTLPSPKQNTSNKAQTKAGTNDRQAARVEAPPPAPDAAASPTPSPCPYTVEESPAQPMVVSCIHSAKDTDFKHVIFLNKNIERGNNVTVPILGLKAWVDQSKGQSKEQGKEHDPQALRLFLAGHLLPKDEQSSVVVDQGYINFQLTSLSSGNDSDERKAWVLIFT